MMKKKDVFITLGVLIFAGLLLFRLISGKNIAQKGSSERAMPVRTVVRVMPIERGSVQLVLSYVGSLKAKDEINVYSKVNGKLAQYLVNEGDSVSKGQAIALIDRDETGLKYELAPVESPLSGIVGRTLLDKGATILSAQGLSQGTVLAIIVNMDEMVVRLSAVEQNIPYLRTGLKAEMKVDAYPDKIFNGEISKVSQVVEPQTRTLPIEIIIPNPDHLLKSGMFCRIKIVASEHKDVLFLLQDAVIQELGETHVFVVEDHTAKKKKVALGIKEDGRIEITEGLKEGEKVIIFGQQGLKEEAQVEIAQE
ncbi:MAG: efflux RND transporter periplasmic adaptor subunit [Candidatus Omnitrophica bacterium]|nr:efflux RND transporter periplasmic adaptor subunit [Candidatus Omnitrophota bacterium]